MRPVSAKAHNPWRIDSLLSEIRFIRGPGSLIVLWTLFVVLLLVWFLATVGSYTMGGFVHVLLGLAVVALIVQLATSKQKAA